ncbi:acylneuraminate cytidylyltransferase family protein [Ramlibacter sp. Leaf400]|uniref:acylneuraminate cytidylyltransferase family protein n=1 Tax=Ramlibacter sp. Leaf400 TaxID=1736365 RepID=UPI00070092C7|nr:acylneuraminate cytidylyltransferase family protein [Ramlibacter sp. Leaf400]KQT08804.1 flagellar modification protein B [Ramlibacter sp. Leaf400]
MAATIATICARGGSKGLPGKNLRPLAGRPLIVHTIEQALACRGIGAVFVSTDDQAIAEVAREAGAQVPYLRPAELATDEAPKLPAIEHLVAHLERGGLDVKTVVDLQPTSPLRTPQDIESAIAGRGDADLVVSVTEPSHNPYYTLAESDALGRLHLSKPANFARRQDAPAVWGLNGAIYVWRRAALPKAIAQGFWSVGVQAYVMPRRRSIDIDDIEDFELAQWLMQRMQTTGARDGN